MGDTYHSSSRVRWVLLFTIISVFIIPAGLLITFEALSFPIPYYWEWLTVALGSQTAFAITTLAFFWLNQIRFEHRIGRFKRKDLTCSLEFTLLNVAITFVVLYGFYYPISLHPNYSSWVVTMLESLPQIIIYDGSGYPLFANGVAFLSIVLLAPILEEFFFRGILFYRWSHKYRFSIAATLSSILFGILHGEVISAFIFGMLLCYVYQKTQRLIVPIVIHFVNNLIVWIISLADVYFNGPLLNYGLQEFQSEWYYGAFGLIFLIAWGAKRAAHLSQVC